MGNYEQKKELKLDLEARMNPPFIITNNEWISAGVQAKESLCVR